jgi:parallel beta-helix repeat protein
VDTASNGFYFFVPYTAMVKGLEISNFTEAGIYAFGSSVNLIIEDCRITKNLDGISIFGSVAHGDIHTSQLVENLDDGVLVYGASAYALIHDNLISGNGAYGIEVGSSSDSTTIQGNLIGTDSTGTMPYPNGSDGIYLACHNGLVGGENPGDGNTIAFNGRDGIRVYVYDYNMLSRNSIFCNTGLGINLQSNGNGNYASPLILSATTLDASGTAPANSKIELFYDDSCSGCQGKEFIDTVMTDAFGNWHYYMGLQIGRFVTATARDTANFNTSRFATCAPVIPTSLNENSSSNTIKVFPNPARDQFTIYDSQFTMKRVEIVNALGDKVFSAEHMNSASYTVRFKLPAGLYFVKTENTNGTFLSNLITIE